MQLLHTHGSKCRISLVKCGIKFEEMRVALKKEMLSYAFCYRTVICYYEGTMKRVILVKFFVPLRQNYKTGTAFMYICFDNGNPKSKRLLMFTKLNAVTFITRFVPTECHLNCLRAKVEERKKSERRMGKT
jgi:hypothetical protein